MPRRMALLLAALPVAAALAGCAVPAAPLVPGATGPGALVGLTEDSFGQGRLLALGIASFDGVRIHVDVQLPDGEGPFPLLLEYTPYSSTLNPGDEVWGAGAAGNRAGLFANGLASYYVPKGYAVGIAHVRGSGQSGGCFSTGGPEEAMDGHTIVEALANESWSNGRIAMMGTSYVGTTPISTATTNPPHLTTIVPVSAVSEWYRYYFENGEPRFFGELPFGVVYADHPLWAATGFVPKPRNPLGLDPGNVRCGLAQMENAWAQDDYNAYWMARNYVKDLHNATAPMLYAHGFLDENTPTSLVDDFYDAYPGEKRLWMQQHGHGVPGAFEDYHLAVHRWLDFWMLDRPNGALDMPAVILQDNRGRYHVEADWPPRNASLRLFHLAEGTLADEAPADATVSYTDDPRAARGLGGLLEFVSEPFADGLHLSGVVVAELVASSDRADTQFDVQLWEIPAAGDALFVSRGYLDARHVDDLARGKDLTPGEEQLFRVRLHGRDHALAEGSRLALYVGSTDEYVMPDAPGATNTLRLGPDGSRLLVPVLEAPALLDAPPAPWDR